MELSWDENKRLIILAARGLDIADAGQIFERENLTEPDLRFDYGEDRFLTFGFIKNRLCALVWTI